VRLPCLRLPSSKKRPVSVALLLLLQALLLFLLLHLFPLLFLGLLRRLLLAGLDIGLMLLGIGLLLRKMRRALGPLLGVLRRILPRLVQLALEVGLLAVVRSLIRRALRGLAVAPHLIELVLPLLVLVGLLVARVGRRALRRIGRVALASQGFLLVALLGARGTTFVVERELLRVNLPLSGAQLIPRAAQASVDEKFAVAVVYRDAVGIFGLRRTIVERLLTCVEIVRRRSCATARGRSSARPSLGHGLCESGARRGKRRPSQEKGSQDS
jgi:hypothetical protein